MSFIAERPATPAAPIIVLVLMLVASLLVFFTLIRRWTSHRLRFALGEWARENGFRLIRPKADTPLPSVVPKDPKRIANWLLNSDRTTLIQLLDPSDGTRWNLLIRKTISSWPATALRPVAAQKSGIDLFSLEPFPLLPVNERFTLSGSDASRARALGSSSVAGLLPPDVGLVLQGDDLVLDFTARHFDRIEFGRMIAMADQLERAIQLIAPANPA